MNDKPKFTTSTATGIGSGRPIHYTFEKLRRIHLYELIVQVVGVVVAVIYLINVLKP